MAGMDPEDALRALREAAALAPSIRVELDDAYLEALSTVEALTQNQSGADKTWVRQAEDAFRQHHRRVRRV